MTWVNLGRGYGALILPRFVIVFLLVLPPNVFPLVITASGEGEVCSERQ